MKEQKKPIRILEVVNCMNRAGLETVIMNYYNKFNKEQVQMDFLTHRNYGGNYDKEIKKLGGKIYHAPRLVPGNYIKYFIWMKKFFKAHPEYIVVHSHIDTMSFFPLLAAKINHIPVRISHSHSTKLDIDFKLPIKYMAKMLLPYVSNYYWSCGRKAGEFLYGKKKFFVMNNACDLQKFKFNEEIRNAQRVKYNLEGKFVIGHVGRYIYIKNQSFLIDIFTEILNNKPDSILMLIGSGQDELKLREKVKKLKIDDKVKFLINRNDVNDLYQLMDVFIMPSLFEGLPLSCVEAQANGLPCFISDKISKETILTSNIKMINLDSSAKEWAEEILSSELKRNKNSIAEISNNGYDLVKESKKIQQIYINLYNENKGDKNEKN